MKILVGVKHVPDTDTKIRVAADGRSIEESGVKWIISTYDEFAIEQALQLREAAGGEVVLCGAGREAVRDTLRQGLAMGADRALHVVDPRLERCDGLVRARVLAALAVAEQADLVLVGKYGVGTDEGQTGPMTAEVLNWSHASAVVRLAVEGSAFRAEREVEGGVESIEGRLPAVLSCDKGLNQPRYASLKGIMAAKKKAIDVRTLEALGIEAESLERPRLVWEALELPPVRGAGRMIEGNPQEAAALLVKLLREEAKVI